MRLLISLILFVISIGNSVEFTRDMELSVVYPTADSTKQNTIVPKILNAFKNSKHIGYIIINTDFSETIGYSGGPIKMAIGVDLKGIIQGIQILSHSEPIVLIGIPEKKLMKPFDKYIGFNVLKSYKNKSLEKNKVDIVSGATVTIIVMDDGIISSILKAFRKLSIIKKQVVTEQITFKQNQPNEVLSWQQLINDNSIKRLNLTVKNISDNFRNRGFVEAAKFPESNNVNDNFIDLYLAVVSVPEIGKNLLGKDEYKNLESRIKKGQSAILVMANGLFSFRGSGFVRGGVFDRFQIEQGDEKFRFRDLNYKRLRKSYANNSPEFTEIGLFYLPAPKKGVEKSRFKVTSKFVFSLLVSREIKPRVKQFYNETLKYKLSSRYVDTKKLEIEPEISSENIVDKGNAAIKKQSSERAKLVKSIWKNKKGEAITTATLFLVLLFIFLFQNKLAKNAKLTKIVRYSFLSFVLVWLGFMNNGQLSVVNLFAFFSTFNFRTFLMDPVIFVLWCGTLVLIILWARGAYCGWLCPFGAMQELTNHIARKLKIPQVKIPWGLHERLWAIKYIVFLGLLGVSIYSVGLAEKYAEIEPFKTTIILKFQRAWPFVAYALALLIVNLFIERFFCRYLCPLGAGLSIPAKLKIFDWIKRYPKDCGSPCQVCAKECMVGAIHPEGNINENECVNCLHCQVRYFDDKVCPVVVKKRKKKEKQAEWSEINFSKNPKAPKGSI